ncbi:hypothetical protein BD324DRAFT_161342 [Kockovaella imperatae]|uniref:Uncharacterized protein n=1 Tax=Kockovaella imperatae TaxID=4999 RepID=A0A1Y1UAL0_9TREE|nr:hypothetical protein BD324DRAFT_161342 [Kockovaella imperatae]ORX34584.1 hypothetical protein BD324DRAFT_161342 [Kockovaella imperatae]
MKGYLLSPDNWLCGYSDSQCTCAPYCRCKTFEPCCISCCYRVPSGLHHVPEHILRQLQGLPPTSNMGSSAYLTSSAGTMMPGSDEKVSKGCCMVM